MTPTAHRIRTAIRATLAIALAVFVWLALSHVAAGTTDGPALAIVAAGLLVAVLVLLSRRNR